MAKLTPETARKFSAHFLDYWATVNELLRKEGVAEALWFDAFKCFEYKQPAMTEYEAALHIMGQRGDV